MEVKSETKIREVPVAVQVVGWLLILGGLWAGLETITRLGYRQIHIDLEVLGFFFGIGVLALNPWCRRLALVLLVVGAVDLVAGSVGAFRTEQPLTYDILGVPKGQVPKWILWPISLWAAALILGEAWVLLRKKTRDCFRIPQGEVFELRHRKPWWTAFWVLVISGISAGQLWGFAGMVRDVHPWQFLHQPPGGNAGFEPVGDSGDRELSWHSTIRRDREIAKSDSREITVIGLHQGKEIARIRAKYELAVDAQGAPVKLKMRIFERPDESDYILRAAATVKRYDFRMFFAMVSKESDDSKDMVYLPDSEFQDKFPFRGWDSHRPCPVLMYFVTARGHDEPEGVEVDMVLKPQDPSDPRPFGGSAQPIAWIVEANRLDSEGREVEGSFMRYEIAEGASDKVVKKTARE